MPGLFRKFAENLKKKVETGAYDSRIHKETKKEKQQKRKSDSESECTLSDLEWYIQSQQPVIKCIQKGKRPEYYYFDESDKTNKDKLKYIVIDESDESEQESTSVFVSNVPIIKKQQLELKKPLKSGMQKYLYIMDSDYYDYYEEEDEEVDENDAK